MGHDISQPRVSKVATKVATKAVTKAATRSATKVAIKVVPKVATKGATKAATKVESVEVGVEQAGQRIDNFLIKYLKGVPKTRLYRALRSGEVRVNGARKKAPYQLCVGDRLRIPPIRRSQPPAELQIPDSLLEKIPALFEDRHMLVVNKPAGLASHGGTGMPYGLIEALRKLRPDLAYLELAHRLDRETSGCLMLAKSRASLLALQAQLGTERSVGKEYVALVKGAWSGGEREVDIPLTRVPTKRPVNVVEKTPAKRPARVVEKTPTTAARELQARSVFSARWSSPQCALVDIRLLTGRMHQARIHAASIGNPIAGDRLYGDREFNRHMKKLGLSRLFLHAQSLRFSHPATAAPMEIHAPLPASLQQVLDKLPAADSASSGDEAAA